jgi:cyclic pyranopterin phosphate synthase
MPAEGLVWKEREDLLTLDEIVRVAALFGRLGVTKVRLTGGEPTVRPGIEGLIARISDAVGHGSVYMTTNGYRLSAKLSDLRAAGLAGVNVSLDSLRRDRFETITRRDGLAEVLKSIDAAEEAGIPSLKINAVVMAGVNEDEILDFVEFVRDRPITMRFIEFMPFKANGWKAADVYPYARMREDIATRYHLIREAPERGAVGKDFRIEGFLGKVGFVTSMSDSFCSTCNRIRVTADGQIKSCLFGAAESNMRDRLRAGATDDEIEEQIRGALFLKQREHAPMEELLHLDNRSMIQIGG